jgi:hypothetical protein
MEGLMLNNKILRWLSLGVAMLLGTFAAVVHANVPKGWFLAGSNPKEFESGVDPEQTYQAHASAFLKSKQTNVDGFGTLMQRVTAEQYKGKRIRLSGLVKSQDVVGCFGILLAGSGEVWLSRTNFDVVDDDVPVTGLGDNKAPKAPVNLDFTE